MFVFVSYSYELAELGKLVRIFGVRGNVGYSVMQILPQTLFDYAPLIMLIHF
jgi:hypothetical protein